VPAVAAARAAMGPDISLMVDTNCAWDDPDEIVAVCRAIEPYDVAWLEEPLYPADAYDVMARIRRQVRVPLAAGENLGNFNDARWIVEAQAVDIVQPSAAKIGGITELRRTMVHIAAHGLRAVPHSPLLGPSLIATLHVIAAAPTELLCEHRYCDLEASPLGNAIVARDGALTVPSGPGLGFEVDDAVIGKYPRM
jgi:L-alanine-DL-glutamate epimerase-like enolase superfamily enzyme